MKKIIFLMMLITAVSSLFSQDLSLMLRNLHVVEPYEKMYFSSFDPYFPEKQPLVFSVETRNNSLTDTVSFYLFLEIIMNDTELLSFNDAHSNLIELQPGRVIYATNRDLINENGTHPFVLEGNLFNITDNSELDNFKKSLFKLGYFPAYTYKFQVKACSDPGGSNTIAGPSGFEIMITNPKSIVLISPGNNSLEFPQIIEDQYPLFIWNSIAKDFTFKLYQVPDNATSLTDVMNNRSNLLYNVENLSMNSITYPFDAPELMNSKIYAWQVIAEINTTLGIETIPSEVNVFKYSSLSIADEGLLSLLENILRSKAPELLNEIEKRNFKITDILNLDDNPITRAELNDILLDLNNNLNKIITIDIE